ncbi:MAG TPA: hypothetical protein VL325_01060 [Pyrinomonadaceae bacterium]|nr:hypothetical protein [Pyrinomonadaceae bacterium]
MTSVSDYPASFLSSNRLALFADNRKTIIREPVFDSNYATNGPSSSGYKMTEVFAYAAGDLLSAD